MYHYHVLFFCQSFYTRDTYCFQYTITISHPNRIHEQGNLNLGTKKAEKRQQQKGLLVSAKIIIKA